MRYVPLLLAIAFISSSAIRFNNRTLTELKRDLTKAQKELSKAKQRVEKLEEAIAQKEIQRIEKEIQKIGAGDLEALHHSREQRLAFFSNQRETLATIIHKHPICATQAQAVLDEILTLITHISDESLE